MTESPGDFRIVRGREGYAIEEVDRFLDRLAAALGGRPPSMTAEQVAAQRFSPVRMRAGYDMGDVDAFLDRAAAELRRRHAESADLPWELGTAGHPGRSSAGGGRPAPHPGPREHDSPYPAWVRMAALVALVALVGLALAQVL